MVDRDALHAALVEFATRLTEGYDADAVLHEVSDLAVTVMGLDGAGLTIGTDPRAGRMTFVTATDAATEEVERAQDAFGEGVCHDAGKLGALVLVADLAASAQWPRYSKAALSAGFHAVAGIPMSAQGRLIGVLNAYRREAGAWSDEDVAAGALLARMAATYLLNGAQLNEAQALARQLQNALDSRVVIEQAKGILGERLQVDPDRAFHLIRAYTRANRRPLREVAAAVINGTVDIGSRR
jgi:GAF domain-containing protein